MRNRHIYISIIVPFTIVGFIALFSWVFMGVGLVSNDCYEQYVPFFTAYYDIITQGKSFFYSLTGSMGYDFYAVFSYYLVSPFNLIILFFGKTNIIYIVNFLIILKLSLSGGSFAAFLKNRYPKATTYKIVLFSTIFALSGFSVGYAWNIMWLDGILMFPLVIMGLDLLMKESSITKWYWYTIFLAIQIVTSYFIGYMTCIFIFLYFFTYDFKNIKFFIKKFFQVGISSLLAIGLSSIILLPAFEGLSSTSIVEESLPSIGFYGSYIDSIKTILIGVPQIGISFDSEYSNLFMTIFVSLLSGIYIASSCIKKSNKIKQILLIGFLIFSMNFRPLNYIWHGMHEQTGIPNRFAFMVIFIVMIMAFELTMQPKGNVKKTEMFAGWLLMTIVFGVIGYFDHNMIYSAIGSIVLGLFYCIILTFVKKGKIKRFLIGFFVISEVTGMFILGMLYSCGSVMGDYAYYMEDFNQINTSKEIGFYREKIDETYNEKQEYYKNNMLDPEWEEITPTYIMDTMSYMKNMGHLSIVNEATIYGIQAMSLFNTFNNYAQTKFYSSIGATGGTNNVMYYGENAFMDMLLGVKYYYVRYEDVNATAYEYLKTVGEVDVYKNRYALSVGYSVPEMLLEDQELLQENPFDTMNNISQNIIGENIFQKENFILEDNESNENNTKSFFYQPMKTEELFVQIHTDNESEIENIEININGEKVNIGNGIGHIMDLGQVEALDEITIIVTFKDPQNMIATVLSAAFIEGKMEQIYQVLSQEQLKITEYSDDYLKGYVTINQETDFLITIPYTEGWTVTVDGESVDVELFCDLYTVVTLDRGVHYIEMSYKTPGFYRGTVITIFSGNLLLLGLAITILRIKRNKSKNKGDL